MSVYDKPALTIDEQIDLLIQRGLRVGDREEARHFLRHINYYRLRAYWLPFEKTSNDTAHEFREGADFSTIIAIYDFDRELRLLLLDAIERIEISLRARLAHVLALHHGPFAHQDASYFNNFRSWQNSMEELAKEYRRSRETFANHYRQAYSELDSPPIWVATELMTLGHISRWLQNLKDAKDRQTVADDYGLDEKVLVSFAHHLTIVRNHCAHHGRIWNRKIALKMRIPGKKPSGLSSMFNPSEDQRLYNTLTLLVYLMGIISPVSTWRNRVRHLIQSTLVIDATHMGFPSDWQTRAIWFEATA